MRLRAILVLLSISGYLSGCLNNTEPKVEDNDTIGIIAVPSPQPTYSVATFQDDSLGWGYDVLVDGKVYIHQPHMPAISGNRGFGTEEFARTAALFVVYKLEQGINPPSISVSELDSIGVLDNNNE